MPQKTVEQFAGELKLPTPLLLEQLTSAGVHKTSAEDELSEADKAALLEYLRKEHGTQAPKGRIILNRKYSTVIRATDNKAKASTISIFRNQQRLFERLVKEIESLNAQRNVYFNMSLNELEEIYNAGKNELLDEDEKKIIRAAIRKKKDIT